MTCKDCLFDKMCFLTHTDNSPACCEAKDKSRIIELPCKVGDVVCSVAKEYTPCSFYKLKPSYGECANCRHFHKDCDSKSHFEIKEFTYFLTEMIVSDMRQDKFGKTIFVTRKAAEKALKELRSDTE